MTSKINHNQEHGITAFFGKTTDSAFLHPPLPFLEGAGGVCICFDMRYQSRLGSWDSCLFW
jgi:hypothetical protein